MSIKTWRELIEELPNEPIRDRLKICPHGYAAEQILLIDQHQGNELIVIDDDDFVTRANDIRMKRFPLSYDAMVLPDIVSHYNYLCSWSMAVRCMRERLVSAKPKHLQALIDKIVAGQLDGDDWTSVKKEGDSQLVLDLLGP
jgi:hypothetical protein